MRQQQQHRTIFENLRKKILFLTHRTAPDTLSLSIYLSVYLSIYLFVIAKTNAAAWMQAQDQLQPLQDTIERIYGDAQVQLGIGAPTRRSQGAHSSKSQTLGPLCQRDALGVSSMQAQI